MNRKLQHSIEMVKSGMAVVGAMGSVVAIIFLTDNVWLPPVVVGLVALAYCWYQLSSAAKVGAWPQVVAKVDRVKIMERPVPGQNYSFKEYFPYLRYTYFIDGAEYESEAYAWVPTDFSSSERELAVKCVEGISVGTEIKVFLNPKNSEESYVVSGLSPRMRSHYLAIAVGTSIAIAVFLCAGYYVAL